MSEKRHDKANIKQILYKFPLYSNQIEALPISNMDELPNFMSPILSVMEILYLETDLLKPAPKEWNFFSPLPECKMVELLDSIQRNGLLYPITVWKQDDNYMILSGHNRVRAYRMLFSQSGRMEYSKIPCNVKTDLTEAQAQEILIDANWIHRTLSPSERTHSICKKYKLMGRSPRSKNGSPHQSSYERIAQDYNLSARQVHRYLQLGRLHPKLLQLVDEGTLSMRQGLQLARYSMEEQEVLSEYTTREEFKMMFTHKDAQEVVPEKPDMQAVTFNIPQYLVRRFVNHVAHWLDENNL